MANATLCNAPGKLCKGNAHVSFATPVRLSYSQPGRGVVCAVAPGLNLLSHDCIPQRTVRNESSNGTIDRKSMLQSSCQGTAELCPGNCSSGVTKPEMANMSLEVYNGGIYASSLSFNARGHYHRETEHGEPCIFPFRYPENGPWHNDCISDVLEAPWCVTNKEAVDNPSMIHLNEKFTYEKFSNCTARNTTSSTSPSQYLGTCPVHEIRNRRWGMCKRFKKVQGFAYDSMKAEIDHSDRSFFENIKNEENKFTKEHDTLR